VFDLTSFAQLYLRFCYLSRHRREKCVLRAQYLYFLIFNDLSKPCSANAIVDRNSSPMQSLYGQHRTLSRVACNAFIRRIIICTGYIAKHVE